MATNIGEYVVMLDMWVFNHPRLGTKCCLMVLNVRFIVGYNIANNLNMAQLSQLPVLPHESVAEVSKIGNL
jgi:hypothetical protein